MSRSLKSRPFLSGRANLSPPLVQRTNTTIDEPATQFPASQVLLPEGNRLFSDGEQWLGDLAPMVEVMIPAWRDVPAGWFEVGGVTGLPSGRRLISNKYSVNYVTPITLSWIVVEPANLYVDAARQTQVGQPPSVVGGITDVSGNDRHWTQTVSNDRMTWDQEMLGGSLADSIISTSFTSSLKVDLGDGSAAGTAIVFFTDMVVPYSYVSSGGGITDGVITFQSEGGKVQEHVFFDRELTATEIEAFIADVQEERKRTDKRSPVEAGLTSLSLRFGYFDHLRRIPQMDTAGVTNWFRAFRRCRNLIDFPVLDTSAGVNFGAAWLDCASLVEFPNLDFDEATTVSSAWNNCSGLLSFPKLGLPKVTSIASTWRGTSALTEFPAIDFPEVLSADSAWRGTGVVEFPALSFPKCTNFSLAWYQASDMTSFGIGKPGLPAAVVDMPVGANFYAAWFGCSSLTTFPAGVFDTCTATDYGFGFNSCALTQQSVDNILVSIAQSVASTPSLTNGSLDISGGTSATPSATGQSAADALRAAGWTVSLNGY